MENLKITFYSNFLNHHQIPFCNEMYKLLGDSYKYVATEKIADERIQLGYKDVSKDYGYAINAYENEQSYNLAMKLGLESDLVIIGSAPDIYIKERLRLDKLTFRYSERLFKRGTWRLLDPRVLKSNLIHHTRYRNKNLHMLCASGYTASDVSIIGAYPNKTYKWGYFTEVKEYNVSD